MIRNLPYIVYVHLKSFYYDIERNGMIFYIEESPHAILFECSNKEFLYYEKHYSFCYQKNHQLIFEIIGCYPTDGFAILVISSPPHHFNIKDDHNECAYCYNPALYRCLGCETVCYCSLVCQKKDWANHKEQCTRLMNKKRR